jgi:hypothetical protein
LLFDEPPLPVLLGIVPASPVPVPPLLDELHENEDNARAVMTMEENALDMTES